MRVGLSSQFSCMISATKNLSAKSMANTFPTHFCSASCEEPALVTSHYTSCMHQFISAASVLATFPFSHCLSCCLHLIQSAHGAQLWKFFVGVPLPSWFLCSSAKPVNGTMYREVDVGYVSALRSGFNNGKAECSLKHLQSGLMLECLMDDELNELHTMDRKAWQFFSNLLTGWAGTLYCMYQQGHLSIVPAEVHTADQQSQILEAQCLPTMWYGAHQPCGMVPTNHVVWCPPTMWSNFLGVPCLCCTGFLSLAHGLHRTADC